MSVVFDYDNDHIFFPTKEDDNGASTRILLCNVDITITEEDMDRKLTLEDCFVAILPDKNKKYAIFQKFEDAWEWYQSNCFYSEYEFMEQFEEDDEEGESLYFYSSYDDTPLEEVDFEWGPDEDGYDPELDEIFKKRNKDSDYNF